MKANRKLAAAVFALICLAGCTSEQVSRNVYEGARARSDAQRTPIEKSVNPSLDYDRYEKERQGTPQRSGD